LWQVDTGKEVRRLEHQQEDAARQLGWTPATVNSRLYRGRDLLRRRLTRRGLSLGAGILATVLIEPSAAAAMVLVRKKTVKAVVQYTAGKTVGTLSAQVVSLAEQTLPLMATTKARLGVAIFLVMTMIAAGAGLFAHQPSSSNGEEKTLADQPHAQS